MVVVCLVDLAVEGRPPCRADELRAASNATQFGGVVLTGGRKLRDRPDPCTLPIQRLDQGLGVDEVDLDVLIATGARFLLLLGLFDRFGADADLDGFSEGDDDAGNRSDHPILNHRANSVGAFGEVVEQITSRNGRSGLAHDFAGAVGHDQFEVIDRSIEMDRQAQYE